MVDKSPMEDEKTEECTPRKGERVVEIGTSNFTEVICTDEQGAGGACHEYLIRQKSEPIEPVDRAIFAKVYFQNGPVKEAGVNGCHQEDLIAIVIDRLQHFQAGDYACEENAVAQRKLEEALLSLKRRTDKRVTRGVEGTSQV